MLSFLAQDLLIWARDSGAPFYYTKGAEELAESVASAPDDNTLLQILEWLQNCSSEEFSCYYWFVRVIIEEKLRLKDIK